MTDNERNRIDAICKIANVGNIGDLSDGFHTFNQLYYQRMMLFLVIVKQNRDRAWKSFRHEDGELCFGGGWFIIGITTPKGEYTYHYEEKYYSLFDCKELERGKHWDGHTEKDVARLLSLPSAEKTQLSEEDATKDATFDTISRKQAIDSIVNTVSDIGNHDSSEVARYGSAFRQHEIIDILEQLPSAKIERDIPIKPKETTDKAWGIPSRQAVCPKCDYYLGHIAFLDCYKGKRITYCETCGQAIDWEGWDFDE